MLYLTNAFSINMIRQYKDVNLNFRSVSLEEAQYLMFKDYRCVIGHADTARLVGNLLDQTLVPERVSIQLNLGPLGDDEVLVAQYTGPRLPEGATELPEGAMIEFYLVS